MAAVPPGEIADEAYPLRCRSPHGKRDAGYAIHGGRMCSQLFPETAMRSFVEQMQVHVAQRGREAIRIVALPDASIAEVRANAISEGESLVRKECRKERVSRARHLVRAPVFVDELRSGGAVVQGANDDAWLAVARRWVRAQDRVRVVKPSSE